MILLQEHVKAVLAQNEVLRLETLQQLRLASHQHLKGCKIWIFGSLAKKGGFRPESDVDLALDHEPVGCSIYGVTALLSETLGRPVDVVLIDETRFKNLILKSELSWIA